MVGWLRDVRERLGTPLRDADLAQAGPLDLAAARDLRQAVRLIADGTVPADRLISKVVRLAEAPSAFEALEAGGDVMKILVDCGNDTTGALV